MKDCVFCRIVAGELPCDQVYEDDLVLAFLDIAPLSAGHTLLIPKVHHTSVTTLPTAHGARLMQVAGQLGAALLRVTDGDGFNLLLSNGACAGQVVPHVHLHVIPRHPDDGIVLPARTVATGSDSDRRTLCDAVRRRLEKSADGL